MEKDSQAMLLRIFISSTDKLDNSLLYEAIVLKAKDAGISGATVLKGRMGFGASSVLLSYRFWEVTEKLPLVIELIDDEEKIMSFYESIRPILESMKYGCLVTTEKINILLYKSGKKK